MPKIRTFVLACLTGWSALAPAATPDHQEGLRLFTDRIRPLLASQCFSCHSHGAERIRGGLVLDSAAGIIAGGDHGPVVVPGRPAESRLIERVRSPDPARRMPLRQDALTGTQIAALEHWIALGAPVPDEPGEVATGRQSGPQRRRPGAVRDEERQWWSFRPLSSPEPPAVADPAWGRNPVDRFIHRELTRAGLRPAPAASRLSLIRRVTLDLTGLPPTPGEIAAFVDDPSPEAYERLVDRLLASPRYGERWGRHWLDLVRYAESDGFRVDDFRPHAWRYRDYVIRSFNRDKPYDRFVQEQLAGDELAGAADPDPARRLPDGDALEAMTGASFLRLWMYEYNNRDAWTQRQNILNDLTDTTADVFLGLGMQCARCHDHKFDPLPQRDYFALQSFFAPYLPRNDLVLADSATRGRHIAARAAWEAATAEIRDEMEGLLAPVRQKAGREAIMKFPPEIQALLDKPVRDRTPEEQVIGEVAYWQVTYDEDKAESRLKGAEKERFLALKRELARHDGLKPASLPVAWAGTDMGTNAPATFIPRKPGAAPVEPAWLTVLGGGRPEIHPAGNSTGRRTALARWLTRPDHPLTTRVIVNRVWQQHFGRGLAVNTSDFGTLGERPSHPELLDWLARWFVAEGWSFKKLHRLLVTSEAYRQSAVPPDEAGSAAEFARTLAADPENRWLGRFPVRRLDAEQLRDALLAVSGELDPGAGGPSVPATKPRRTIYTRQMRNVREPLLEAFDQPDGMASASERNVTTTPNQALLLINSQALLLRADALAGRVRHDNPESDDAGLVRAAYRRVLGRVPSQREETRSMAFLLDQSRRLREAGAGGPGPVLVDRMPYHEGRAAMLEPRGDQSCLTVAGPVKVTLTNFSIEAFVLLRSLHEDGQVRTIAAHWDGQPRHDGWAFGVTGRQSRRRPQTLVLQVAGGPAGVEVPVFSDLVVPLNKPCFVAAIVRLAGTNEPVVTFHLKDLSNDDEPMQVATVNLSWRGSLEPSGTLALGARPAGVAHPWDGLLDDIRLTAVALRPEQLLVASEAPVDGTLGFWQFESRPSAWLDSSPARRHLLPKPSRRMEADAREAAFVDFCHVLLNASEFLYVD